MRKKIVLCSTFVLLVLLLASCGTPDASFLKKNLQSNADFFGLFDAYVGKSTDKYTISSVHVTYSHEENKGRMEMTAAITCVGDSADYSGVFDFVLNKYDNGWDIDEMSVESGNYKNVSAPTEGDILAHTDLDGLKKVGLTAESSLVVSNITQDMFAPEASADVLVTIMSPVIEIKLPVQLDLTYNGAWEITSNSIENMTAGDFDNAAQWSLRVPMGTYLESVRGDYEAITIYERVPAAYDIDNPVQPVYSYYSYSYDVFDDEIDNFNYGDISISNDLTYLTLGGDQITVDDEKNLLNYNENITVTYISSEITPERALDALIAGYQDENRGMSINAINRFIFENHLDVSKISSYPHNFSARLDMNELLSANLLGASFLSAAQEGWLSEWVSLYIYGASDLNPTCPIQTYRQNAGMINP